MGKHCITYMACNTPLPLIKIYNERMKRNVLIWAEEETGTEIPIMFVVSSSNFFFIYSNEMWAAIKYGIFWCYYITFELEFIWKNYLCFVEEENIRMFLVFNAPHFILVLDFNKVWIKPLLYTFAGGNNTNDNLISWFRHGRMGQEYFQF